MSLMHLTFNASFKQIKGILGTFLCPNMEISSNQQLFKKNGIPPAL